MNLLKLSVLGLGLAGTAEASETALRELTAPYSETVHGQLRVRPASEDNRTALAYLVVNEVPNPSFHEKLLKAAQEGGALHLEGNTVWLRLGCLRGDEVLDQSGKPVVNNLPLLHNATYQHLAEVRLDFDVGPSEAVTGLCSSPVDRATVVGFTGTKD